jgi:hypothetical protein
MSSADLPILGPLIAAPSSTPFTAAGTSLVIREWTDSGPSYLHIHRTDDEAWHVLEGSLRFTFADRTIDASVGATVFVPAGVAHTYCTLEPSRYLIFLTPRLDRLIARLRELRDGSQLRATLAEFDTVIVE